MLVTDFLLLRAAIVNKNNKIIVDDTNQVARASQQTHKGLPPYVGRLNHFVLCSVATLNIGIFA